MNNRPRRGYSPEEVEAGILKSQEQRYEARKADPRWTLEPDELTAVIGGGIWQYKGDD